MPEDTEETSGGNGIEIHTEFITLGQLLKLSGIVDTGGEVKSFLTETSITVNGEHDNRRGRKVYPGDRVRVEGHPPLTITTSENENGA